MCYFKPRLGTLTMEGINVDDESSVSHSKGNRRKKLTQADKAALVARLSPEMVCPDAEISSVVFDQKGEIPVRMVDGTNTEGKKQRAVEFWCANGVRFRRLTPRPWRKTTMPTTLSRRMRRAKGAVNSDLVLVFERTYLAQLGPEVPSSCKVTVYPSSPHFWGQLWDDEGLEESVIS